jgi:DNA-binding transcriptional MerR regulator
MTKPLMTLTELADAAAAVVADVGQQSGRVREQPDIRTIRYYTTLGLIDRAAEMRGRTAYYNERHLRQLVAIKRMQADGMTLQQIQDRLLGISPQALRALAPLPDRPPGPPGTEQEPKNARAGFWRDRPAKPAPSMPQPKTMQTIAIGQGVLLTVDSEAQLSPEQYQAILEAAQPLLRALEQTKRSEQ